jgi:hypothetical protein
MSSNDNSDLELAFFGIVTGAILVYRSLQRFRRTRIVQDTTRSKIASAPMGLAEIQGFAWPQELVVNCLRGRNAIYQKLELQKLVKRGKNSSWVTKWSREHKPVFYVLDETGLLEVDPAEAEFEIQSRVLSWSKLTQTEKDNTSLLGISESGFPPSKAFFGWSPSFRFVESVILLGAPVYVHGTLSPAKGKDKLPPSLSLKRFRDFLQRHRGRNISENLWFDLNRDGKVSAEEASLAANKFGEKAFDSKLNHDEAPAILPGQVLRENIIYGRMSSCTERKLFLADCHEDHLVKRVGSWNLLRLLGGAALIGAGVYWIIYRFFPRA